MRQAIASWLPSWPRDMEEPSDLELVERTKAGDTEAYSQLVRRHQHTIYNLCYRFMRNPSAAEDMAQEAFLKGFRMLRGFRGDSAFSTWMYRVACSVCLTELKRRKRRGEIALSDEHAAHLHEAPPAPSDTSEIIRRCVTKLPEKYALIITMYYLKEITYEEIAEVMDIPMGTLKTWMHRARNQLRNIVEKELAGEARDAL